MGNEPWAYLLTEQMDYRAMLVAGYLHKKIKGTTILDLNCGHAPLLKYIPDTYHKYYGNDLLTERFPMGKINTNFFTMTDDKMVNKMKGINVDILLVFGHGGWEITHEPLESKTATTSILKLITQHSPRTVVLEAITEFLPILLNIVTYAKTQGYKIKYNLDIKDQTTGEQRLSRRTLIILEK